MSLELDTRIPLFVIKESYAQDFGEIFWEEIPTDMSKRLRWWSKFFLLLLNFFWSIFPTAQAFSDIKKNEIIVMTAKEILDENFIPGTKEADLVIKALKLIPYLHYKSLENLKIKKYDKLEPRGKANSENLILNKKNMDNAEFLSVFLHEMGHVTDLGMLTPDKKNRKSKFYSVYQTDPSIEFYEIDWESVKKKKQTAKIWDFVSEYSRTDVFEDFAESYIFYILHGEQFRNLVRKYPEGLLKKYKFLKQNIFWGQEYDFSKNNFKYSENIFDITKIEYDLEKFLLACNEAEKHTQEDFVRRSRFLGRMKRKKNYNT